MFLCGMMAFWNYLVDLRENRQPVPTSFGPRACQPGLVDDSSVIRLAVKWATVSSGH